jgi:hypothetical protein
MYKPSTGDAYMYVPITGPSGVNIQSFAVSVALILEGSGGEPALSDYKTATWVGTEAALLLTEGLYPDGEYLVWVRIVASPEDLRLPSGRCRIGDART